VKVTFKSPPASIRFHDSAGRMTAAIDGIGNAAGGLMVTFETVCGAGCNPAAKIRREYPPIRRAIEVQANTHGGFATRLR